MTDIELEKIYHEAYRAVYWTAMSLLRNEADAEDVVQDTFVTLIKSYGKLEDTSKVVPLLKKIAANKCLDRLKSTKTENVEDEFLENIETVPEDFLPDSIIESEASRKIVMDIINHSLSEDVRRTLILFYFNEMSTKEIADALGIPQGTVLWRLNFARKRIKKEVEKYEEDNDTKLFAMVLPFLSKLFIKEAEQVPLRPMPTSLVSLSASTEATKAQAESELALKAMKKGTGIMKSKIVIGSIAAVVAVGIITGVVIHVSNKKETKKADPGRESENHERVVSGADRSDGYMLTSDTDNSDSENEDNQVIPEDAVFFDMSDMSASEIVSNIQNLLRIEEGTTTEEYSKRFVENKDCKIMNYNSTKQPRHWLINGIGSACYINEITVTSVGEVSCNTFSFDENSNVMVNIKMEDPAFSSEVFQAICDWLSGISDSVDKKTDLDDTKVYDFTINGIRYEMMLSTIGSSFVLIQLFLPISSQ